jgi:1,4-dihydroxy-2-naphthoate polyprenyltransferase
MKYYIKAMRLPFLTGSLVPALLAAGQAYVDGFFRGMELLLILLGVGSLQTAANLINDYYDARGSDPVNLHPTPFSGGSRVIPDKLLSPAKVLTAAIFFFSLALSGGFVLWARGHVYVAYVGLFGLLSAVFYSVNPIKFMSRGLGEMTIFFAFGPIVTWGTYYVLTDHLTWPSFFLGFPLGFLITAVIWINQFPDYKADLQAEKKNLVVRLGLSPSRWIYLFLMLLPFPFLVFLAATQEISYLVLLALLVLPLALKAIVILWNHFETVEKVVPAQALTIQTHLGLGLLMLTGILAGHFLGL